jgi:hypothetical protein
MRVLLHGGPWHGRVVAVQEGRDHIHIIEPVAIIGDFTETDDRDEPIHVETREGMYSQVAMSPGDFEWDGWRSHD